MPSEPPSTSVLTRVLRSAASAGVAPSSIDELHTALSTRRRRRARLRTTGLAAMSAAGVVAIALVATSIPSSVPASRPTPGPAAGSPTAATETGIDVPRGWSVLPASPLTPRTFPVMAALGSEVLVIGGDDGSVCPPNADCLAGPGDRARRDGAAYDVDTRTWRALADAPLPVWGTRPAIVGGSVHLLVGRDSAHLSYDVADDTWTRLPNPPGEPGHRPTTLAAAGDKLVAYTSVTDRPDLLYDPASRAWSSLPKSPLEPAFDRQYVWTGKALVLLAAADVPQPGSDGPSFQRAAVLDLDTRKWRRLPDATETITGSFNWSWDGRRVVSASRQTADGGAVNGYGRSYSSGGTLDPSTGSWGTLPPGPPDGTRPESNTAYASGLRYKADGNALYDTVQDRWVQVLAAPEAVAPYSGQTWVGDVLFVWGGATPFDTSGGGELVATGGLFKP